MSKTLNVSADENGPASPSTGVRRGLGYLVRPFRSVPFFSWLLACRYDLATMLRGARSYRRTGVTPDDAYQSLINLHCRTQGFSSDFFAWLLRIRQRPLKLADNNGVLGQLAQPEIERIVGEVQQNGYYVFPQLLAAETCERLVEFALTRNCEPSPAPLSPRPPGPYDRDRPMAETYRFAEQTLLDNTEVQELISDHSILALAQSYLGTPPILDIVTMWWSTAMSQVASEQAAQLYHFDMDRVKWLKIFFYLTDVTLDNGPHCFVAKSHKRRNQPYHLLKRGYVRIPDEDINACYARDDIKEITGPRGTIFVADTRAFHKGKPVKSGDRLLLQFEFCTSLFGGAYTKSQLRSNYDPHLLDLARSYSRVYSKFDVTPK